MRGLWGFTSTQNFAVILQKSRQGYRLDCDKTVGKDISSNPPLDLETLIHTQVNDKIKSSTT